NSSRPVTAPFPSVWTAHDFPWPESASIPALPSRQGILHVCLRSIRCRSHTHWSGKLPVCIAVLPPSGHVPPPRPSPRQHRPTNAPLACTPNHNPPNTTKPIKDRGSRQGLVHRAVSSVPRHPTPSLLSSFFGRETEETFVKLNFLAKILSLFSSICRHSPPNPPIRWYIFKV